MSAQLVVVEGRLLRLVVKLEPASSGTAMRTEAGRVDAAAAVVL